MYSLKCSYRAGALPPARATAYKQRFYYGTGDIERNSTCRRSIYVTKRFGFAAADDYASPRLTKDICNRLLRCGDSLLSKLGAQAHTGLPSMARPS